MRGRYMCIKKMNELEKVKWGLQQIEFAFKFYKCCFDNEINCKLFKPKLTVKVDNDTINIPEWDIFTQDELVKQALNQTMTSVGVCVIAVDQALSAKHGNSSFKNWQNNPNDLNSLREIIFLIRSAYAHKIPDVYWHISGDRTAANYVVNTPGGPIKFNANGKHGTKLEVSHFNGFEGFIHLVKFALNKL